MTIFLAKKKLSRLDKNVKEKKSPATKQKPKRKSHTKPTLLWPFDLCCLVAC
jgi:hypothetical protein